MWMAKQGNANIFNNAINTNKTCGTKLSKYKLSEDQNGCFSK